MSAAEAVTVPMAAASIAKANRLIGCPSNQLSNYDEHTEESWRGMCWTRNTRRNFAGGRMPASQSIHRRRRRAASPKMRARVKRRQAELTAITLTSPIHSAQTTWYNEESAFLPLRRRTRIDVTRRRVLDVSRPLPRTPPFAHLANLGTFTHNSARFAWGFFLGDS
jgi:hypothetical protein